MRKDWDDCGSLAITSDVYGSQCPPRSDLQEILIRFALPHLGTLKGSRQSNEVRKDHSEFEYEVSTALTERLVEMEKTPCAGSARGLSTAELAFGSNAARHSWCTDCGRSFRSPKQARDYRLNGHGGF
ncbi:hypothetical protein AnigIFM59636_003523 [Aspergillus niger]|nr:hypothetical protein AnigIFM59636_003523 [Aspergillus niger]